MTRAPIALAAIFMAGCYDAPRPECGFRCGPSAACPDDYTCASDSRCHRNGAPPDMVCESPDAMPPPDAYSPRVVFTNPTAGAMVDPATTIEVGFDVDVVRVTSLSFKVSITSTSMPVIGVVNYDPPTRRATFDANGLPQNAELLVRLTDDISDPESNRSLMPTSFTFRTGSDTTAPAILATNPATGSMNAPVVSSVSFAFSEDVSNANGTTVSVSDSLGPIAGTVNYFPAIQTAVFAPQDQLEPNHPYTGRVTTGVTDLSGNALATTFTMTFSTGADTFAPNVRVSAPANGDTNVPVNSNIVVTFDEPVGNVTATSFQVNGGAITGTLTPSNNNKVWTFDPASDLPAGSTITVSLSAAIEDLSGNTLTATSYSFTTM
jgi:hypothetical protein